MSFENVVFGYSPTNPILKGVSFTIGGGKTLALVGATGSGKSTVREACCSKPALEKHAFLTLKEKLKTP